MDIQYLIKLIFRS